MDRPSLHPSSSPARDRAERLRAAAPAVGVVVLLVAVFAAVWAGERAVSRAAPELRPVPATTVAAAPQAARPGELVAVDAVWTAPDGTPRAGSVAVAPLTPAATPVRIWTDAAGARVVPPDTGTGAALLTGGAVLLLGAGALRAGLRRAAARADREGRHLIAAEWAAVEPVWSAR